MGEKCDALQSRIGALVKANEQLQSARDQAAKQAEFYRGIITQLKAGEAEQQEIEQQQKREIETLETKLAEFAQQAGLEAVFQHQLKLEAQIEALKQRLAEEESEAQEVRKQLKITANALLLKESELIPDRRTSKEMLRNSLLRTIAALKDEADGLELMCEERNRRIAGFEEQLQVIQAENEQLQQESAQLQEVNSQLIRDNVELREAGEKAQAALQRVKAQAQELSRTNAALAAQNQEIPELKRTAEKAFLADELEKQLKLKQKNFDIVSQNYAKLQQEVQEKTSQFERTESEFRLFRTQFSDDKFAEVMNENQKLLAENEQLKAQKVSLQRALVVAARARPQATE